MSAGLLQTGVVDIVGRYVFQVAGSNPKVFLPVIMVSVATVSAFMSNTAATAFFVPLVIGYANKIGVTPARFLLPLAFASILTSSVTLVSTSTNLLVSDLLTRYQQPPMAMFELAPVGIPIAIVGLIYMWLVGVRLMPEREEQKREERIGERKYQADVVIEYPDADEATTTIVEGVLLPLSPLIGQSLRSLEFKERYGLQVLALHRAGRVPRSISSARLRMGDVLLLQGTPENVKTLERGNLFNIFGGVENERLNRSRTR
jgi:di/tricarboxylate transporter